MFKKALALTLALSTIAPFAFAQEREESMVMSVGDSFRKKWNVTFFSIASSSNMTTGTKARNSGVENSAITSYNYFGVNYRIDSDRKVSLRLPFYLELAGTDKYGDKQENDMSLGDIHIAYSMYDLGYIGPVDISGNVKVYLPTSKYTESTGNVARFRGEVYFEYAIGRFSSIQYGMKPDIFWQSRTASYNTEMPLRDDGFFVSDPRSTNKQYSFEHFVELVADVNKYIALKPRVGFDEDWYYSSSAEELEGSHVTKFRAGFGIEVRPVRGITFTLGIQNETNLTPHSGDVAFFMPQNTQYSIMTNAFVF